MGTEFHVSHGVGLFLKKFHVLLQKVVTQTLATRKDRQEDCRTLIANTAMNRRLRENTIQDDTPCCSCISP